MQGNPTKWGKQWYCRKGRGRWWKGRWLFFWGYIPWSRDGNGVEQSFGKERHKKLVKHAPVKYTHAYTLSWVNIGAVFKILHESLSNFSYRLCKCAFASCHFGNKKPSTDNNLQSSCLCHLMVVRWVGSQASPLWSWSCPSFSPTILSDSFLACDDMTYTAGRQIIMPTTINHLKKRNTKYRAWIQSLLSRSAFQYNSSELAKTWSFCQTSGITWIHRLRSGCLFQTTHVHHFHKFID